MPDHALRVAVDARSLNVEHVRGIGKSLYELIKRTASSGAVEWHLLADRPDRPIHVPDERSCRVNVFEVRGHRFQAWEQWALPREARRLDVDLLHAPGTSMPFWQPVPTIVTIHDTIPWQGGDAAWPPGFYRDRVLPAAYRRAKAITTVSETSRNDILARWPMLRSRLHVVSPGVDECYFDDLNGAPAEIDGRPIDEPYLLYIGGSDPRKRLLWALQTWWEACPAETFLVVCGLEAERHAEIRRIVPRQVQDRLILAPFMREDEMPRLYKRATAVLYPTMYEGFGLPVIEAQAVGTPVLFSAVGSLVELQGPGAVVLPPDDLPMWVKTVARIVHARSIEHVPNRLAQAWARQYSWDTYTERTLALYNSVGVTRPARRGRGQHVAQKAAS